MSYSTTNRVTLPSVSLLFCCKSVRINGSHDCPLCGHSHTYRECPDFHISKIRTSLLPYHQRHAGIAEERGFMAAGILLKRRDNRILMIKEIRRGRDKYNFIGGKRECRLDWLNLPRLEQGFETARTEFEEETGQSLPSRTYQSVYWFPDSKYLLFVVNGEIKDHSTRFEWFADNEIQKGIDNSLYHGYINFQLQRIIESK